MSPIIVSLLSLLSAPSSNNVNIPNASDRKEIVSASGYIDAHWEYPTFIPKDIAGYKALPFAIAQKKWQEKYIGLVAKTMMRESICLRVIGRGYVTDRQPTVMWPATKQFVFTKVMKMEKLKSDDLCMDQ